MRILHTADWHLGRRLNRVSRIEEQRALLADLVDRTRSLDPDVVVVAGDVFDVFTPGADAERLYYDTVQRLADGGTRPVLVVAGNHDSPARLTAPRRLLADHAVFVCGDPHDPDDVPEARGFEGFTVHDAGPGWIEIEAGGERAIFHLLAFPARSRLPAHVDQTEATATEIVGSLASEVPEGPGRRYLVGHLYVREGHDVEQDTDDYLGGTYGIQPAALEPYDAAFLGHLHRPFGHGNWRYAGAPMAFDFDDPEQQRGAWLYEDGVGEVVELAGDRPLAEHRLPSFEEAMALAEADQVAWTRLVFERGTVVERQQRERLREAFGDRLVDIRFAQPDEHELSASPDLELGDLDPEQAFRSFVEEEDGSPPDGELVDLFLEVLQPTEDDEPSEAEQATLEVEG